MDRGARDTERVLGIYLPDIIRQNARWSPASMAFAQGDTCLTWAEAGARMQEIGDVLVARGVRRGDRVGVLAHNTIDYVLLQFALADLGAILVPLNYRLHAEELRAIVEQCRPVALLYTAAFADRAREAGGAIGDGARTYALVGEDGRDGLWGWSDFPAVEGPRPVDAQGPSQWTDPVAILYTGGTTGRPKGVVISHCRHIVDGLSVIAAFGLRPGQRFLCCGPLSHTAAWDYIKAHLLVGGSAVMMERFDGAGAVELIDRHRCNGLWAVPLMLREIVSCKPFATADMSSVKLIAYSAYDPSELMTDVVGRFRERGAADVAIAHGYGLTEAGPFVTVLRPEEGLEDPNSVGTPVPGVVVEILDADGRPVPAGEIGEVCVRAAAVMNGYWESPEATEEMMNGGWLHTGDLGRINARGHLVIEGRLKDMIRTGGENVYAKEVETVIAAHPQVVDCAVVGRGDERYEEAVVAVVVVRDAAEVTESELQEFARARIASFKVPREVVVTDALPKTAAGKTDKRALRERNGWTERPRAAAS